MKKSFTLIEFLLVFAIVALMVSIAMTYLLNSQKRSKDTRIIESMDLLRKAANIIYQNNGDYDKVCCGPDPCDSDIKKICDEVDFWNGGFSGISINKPDSPSQSYCAEVRLNLGNWYCVDSALRSFATSNDPICAPGVYSCQ